MFGQLRWVVETRVFASTEGALVTQHFTRGGPRIEGRTWLPDSGDGVGFVVGRWDGESVGFEITFRPEFNDQIIAAVEEAIQWRELPLRSFDDVGRYPIVLDGASFANIVGYTLNLALDGDRLSGQESDASGRSFLQPLLTHPTSSSPPEFSTLLTVSSAQGLPSSVAVRWDDDGVEATPHMLVDKGTVVDFHVTRETAARLASWYQQKHWMVRLYGGCFAPTPASLPMQSGGDLHVASGTDGSTPLELAREMSHGFLVMGGVTRTAPGLTTGLLGAPLVVEIRNGKPVARVSGVRMGFVTNSVLKSGLAALGDAKTLGSTVVRMQRGIPWQEIVHPVTAPAALCKEMDLYRSNFSR
jgi:predicted Zn-dependent protease